jgi:hypothetical protein
MQEKNGAISPIIAWARIGEADLAWAMNLNETPCGATSKRLAAR